jgi:hypothetical protein
LTGLVKHKSRVGKRKNGYADGRGRKQKRYMKRYGENMGFKKKYRICRRDRKQTNEIHEQRR